LKKDSQLISLAKE